MSRARHGIELTLDGAGGVAVLKDGTLPLDVEETARSLATVLARVAARGAGKRREQEKKEGVLMLSRGRLTR